MLQPSYDHGVVALSVLVASYASYVALDLARRVRGSDRHASLVWTLGGALVMGSGIWSMHFVGMLAMSLPIDITYDPGWTLLSWVAAVTVSLLSLRIAAMDRLSPMVLAAGALTMGSGICAMHYIGMTAMLLTPLIVWNAWIVVASALIAAVASAAALVIFFVMRRLHGARAQLAQIGAALVMGLAICGMHYTGMAAAGFPAGAICQNTDGLGGHNLGMMVVLASLALLSLTLFTSILDARMQARATRLADSLHTANQELQGANAELQRMAFRDVMTGMANRMLLEDRLTHALDRIDRRTALQGKRQQPKLALLFVDLDGFKPVNDSYGHAAGDVVLQQVAQRLHRVIRAVDTAARIGGDEFLLLLEDVTGTADAVSMAERLLQSMLEPFQLPDRQVALSCSIGVVIYPGHVDREHLITSADAAMYAAKRAGGSTYAVFEPHMQNGIAEQMDMQQALRGAAGRGELHLHYQPKMDRDGHMLGLEALLRWTHPVLGSVPPMAFIPVAERFGLIIAIGDWVIEEACRQLAAWASEGLHTRVAINLSAYQLRQPDLVEHMRATLLRHGVDPQRLLCEVTETVAMEDTESTQRIMRQLSELGVPLSIDDFGTGYSSLSYLRQLRVQQLKIDRSFIQDLDTSSDARAVVDAVIRLAHSLGLSVVAEGVETIEQCATLIELGCDELQGFYFARPMTAAALRDSGLLKPQQGQQPMLT
jgi:diguanylate cyclase (GGDEF)-like protein